LGRGNQRKRTFPKKRPQVRNEKKVEKEIDPTATGEGSISEEGFYKDQQGDDWEKKKKVF